MDVGSLFIADQQAACSAVPAAAGCLWNAILPGSSRHHRRGPQKRSQADSEACLRNTLTVTDQMAFAAELGAVRGIRAGLWPAENGTTEQTSNTARDQSISAKRFTQSSSTKWVSCKRQLAASHARAATQFFRQHLPGYPAVEDKQNTD